MNRSLHHMVGENTSWWSMGSLSRLNNGEGFPLSQSSSSLLHEAQSNSHSFYDTQEELPQSWSQLLLEGLMAEEERNILSTHFKQDNSDSLNSNMLDFTNSKAERRHLPPDHSYKCNGIETGAALKKVRVQGSSSSQYPNTFKVRKEKLGDRITALHQLVSPFGKTDTASVLLEAIGYIRFLQNQIEALSSPYLNTLPRKMKIPAQGERSCIFPEDSGQLLNDNCLKKRAPADQNWNVEPKKDLKSIGLCLVPISCTLHVDNEDGANFWSQTINGSFR